jgi:hypothetical protein
MKEIELTQAQFSEFDQDDQFGFFYDESGWPTENADDEFEDNVKELYKTYDCILITPDDSVYGVKSGQKTLLMEGVFDCFAIATEVIEEF